MESQMWERKIFSCSHAKYSLNGGKTLDAFIQSYFLAEKIGKDKYCSALVEYSPMEQIYWSKCSVYQMKPVIVHGEDLWD